MISFIKNMKNYADARNPDILIIQQKASALCEDHPELFDIIDAIVQEEVLYDGAATDDWSDPLGFDFIIDQSQTEEYFYYLDQFLASGVPVFNCEYAFNYVDSAYARSYAKGYIPYVTRRSLGKLSTTPSPGILASINLDEEDDYNLPMEYALYQNYPNPFNPSTTIKYSIPHLTHPSIPSRDGKVQRDTGVLVTLKIYNILGQEVTSLVNPKQSPGNYELIFNANNLPSEVYFYRITIGTYINTKKLIIIK